MMICPECKRLGLKSKVYPSESTETLVYYQPFYDENGRYHDHDGNTITTEYSCSRGHRWVEERHKGKCWCGWGAEAMSLTKTGGKKMLKCSKCGKPMETEDGTKVIGLEIKIKIGGETSQSVKNLLLDSLGAYCAYLIGDKDNFEFEANFCYQCWLDSLFMGDRSGLIRQNAEKGR